MIISGTVTSSPVQGATAPAAADSNPLTGFVPVGYNGQWQSKPFGVGGVAANITVTNSLALDWSTSTYFQYLIGAANQTFQPLFVNQTIGQTIRVVISQVPAAIQGLVLWPATTTGVGGVRTSSSITGGVDLFDVTCINQSTFYVNRLGGIA